MRTEPPTGDELARLLVSTKRNVLERAANERQESPGRLQLTDRVVGVVLAVALLLGLGTAGAALAFNLVPPPLAPQAEMTATPTTTPRPSAEYQVATATPTPPPTADPLTTVTTIVVRPEHLDLQDAAGAVVLELSYDDETGHFVQTLSAVLGARPTVKDVVSDSERVATLYTWPGLTVSDDLRSGSGYAPMNIMATFELPILGDGVAVATASGFVPGDDLATFAASMGAAYSPDGAAQNVIALETGPAHAVAASDWGQASTGPSTVFAPFVFGREQGTVDASG
jgi:hypothetical protein